MTRRDWMPCTAACLYCSTAGPQRSGDAQVDGRGRARWRSSSGCTGAAGPGAGPRPTMLLEPPPWFVDRPRRNASSLRRRRSGVVLALVLAHEALPTPPRSPCASRLALRVGHRCVAPRGSRSTASTNISRARVSMRRAHPGVARVSGACRSATHPSRPVAASIVAAAARRRPPAEPPWRRAAPRAASPATTRSVRSGLRQLAQVAPGVRHVDDARAWCRRDATDRAPASPRWPVDAMPLDHPVASRSAMTRSRLRRDVGSRASSARGSGSSDSDCRRSGARTSWSRAWPLECRRARSTGTPARRRACAPRVGCTRSPSAESTAGTPRWSGLWPC